MSLQEEKEKVQAQKEEVLNHVNDVLENELQCIICSEYFIEVGMSGPPGPARGPSLPGCFCCGEPLGESLVQKPRAV